ncbi:hypothetical protein BEH94_08060 [Candidatus Altiarchaeales archaeon WOR_SM1_SCG]|nr:hypothetical protein BEH94_08060 [Candidatus Altiarchaeales archaeon WOR_SM1_SCG]
MATKTIKYSRTINGDFAVVPVFFIKPKLVRVRCLVDNGASYSVFKSNVADDLGINIYKGEPNPIMVGNGQKIIIYIHKLDIRLCGKTIRNAEIGFSNELNTGFNILGRKSIFDKFEICFNDKDKIVKFHS